MRRHALALSLAVLACSVTAGADPTVRPDPPKGGDQVHPGARPRGPFSPPQGKGGFWVPIFGDMPGSGLPILRNWVTDPHEEPAPEEPGDVEGPGGPPCTNC